MIVGHTKTIKGRDTEFFFAEIDSIDLINRGSSKKSRVKALEVSKLGSNFPQAT